MIIENFSKNCIFIWSEEKYKDADENILLAVMKYSERNCEVEIMAAAIIYNADLKEIKRIAKEYLMENFFNV